MGKFRGFDSDEGWIKRRFLKIEKQMREDRAAKRLSASTITGDLTIRDGGSLFSRFTNALGAGVGVRVGPNPLSDVNGPGHSLQVNHENGSAIFTAVRLTPTVDTPGGTSRVVSVVDTFIVSAGGGFQLVDNTGYFISHPSGTFITHSTTGSAANAVLDATTGLVSRSTSSLRYKQDVEDAEVDPAAVLDMQPRTWRDKAEVEKDPETETRYVGFIAEELHELGLGQFVVYDADGDPEAISYDRLSVALLAVLKDLNARVTALETDDAQERDQPDTHPAHQIEADVESVAAVHGCSPEVCQG